MLRIKLIGIGAAGNKAAITAFNEGAVGEDQLLLLNSNFGDIPEDFQKYGAVLSDKAIGTGKERNVARQIAIDYLESADNLVDDFVRDCDLVCIVNSSEGGTGSGASSVLYKYLLNVSNKNVMGFVFTGFEEDGRGMANTLGYFNDIDPSIAVQIISNKKFLPLLGKNNRKAEKLANEEFVERLRIVAGLDLVDSDQNIDKTDLLKLMTTPGYMQLEHMNLYPEPANTDQFNQLADDMLKSSHGILTTPTCKRLGVFVFAEPELQEKVDYGYDRFVKEYGTPYEIFTQVQGPVKDCSQVAVVAAGLEMPLEAMKEVYEKFENKAQQVAKGSSSFAEALKDMVGGNTDSSYDMQQRKQATQEELVEKKKGFFEAM